MNLKINKSIKLKVKNWKNLKKPLSKNKFKINNSNKDLNTNRTIKIKSKSKNKNLSIKNKGIKIKKQIKNNFKYDNSYFQNLKNNDNLKELVSINKFNKIDKNQELSPCTNKFNIYNNLIDITNSSDKFSNQDDENEEYTISSLKEENLSKNIIKEIRKEIDIKYKKSKMNKNFKLVRDNYNKSEDSNNSIESLKYIKLYDLDDQNEKKIKRVNKKNMINKNLNDLLKLLKNSKSIKNNSTTVILINKILKKVNDKNIKKFKLNKTKISNYKLNSNSKIKTKYLYNSNKFTSFYNKTGGSSNNKLKTKNIVKNNLLKKFKSKLKFFTKSPQF